MAADGAPVCQITRSARVSRDDSGTDWLPIREGGRYFDVSIGGAWRGRVALEIRPPPGDTGPVECLETFAANASKLFCHAQDCDVRLWVRRGEFEWGDMVLELGN